MSFFLRHAVMFDYSIIIDQGYLKGIMSISEPDKYLLENDLKVQRPEQQRLQ